MPRRSLFSQAALMIIAACIAIANAAPAQARIRFDLPEQSLEASLRAVGKTANLNILIDRNLVAGLRAPALKAEFDAAQALAQLLQGTGLTYEFVNDNTVVLALLPAAPANGQRNPAGKNATTEGTSPHVPPQTEAAPQRPGFWDRFRLAQAASADDGSDRSAVAADATAPVAAGPVEEIVVTAQKRAERLQEVPVPVTVVSTERLVTNNQLRIQDYAASVPGLRMTPNAASTQMLSMRGISTGGGGGVNPTVGITIDDIPYGSSFGLGGGQVVPDIDPGDLARIEALRGPQGTLYGASSMGGLLKFVTIDPSTDGVSGRLQGGLSSVRNGNSLGYNIRAAANVPVGDTFAVRVSGFHRTDPGYIDDPVLGIDGLNQADADGGRVSALWKPTDVFSLKLGALWQQISGDGSSQVFQHPSWGNQTLLLGDLQQSSLPGGTGSYYRKTQAYNANLTLELGKAELTSIAGYNINSFSDSIDQTYLLGAATNAAFGVSGTPLLNDNRTRKFTQENRFTTPLGARFDWLLGTFYTHEDSLFVQEFAAVDPASGNRVGSGWLSTVPTKYEEYAGFTDVTIHATEVFDIQLGARESHISQDFEQSQVGPLTPALTGGQASPFITSPVSISSNAFTYLATPRLRLSPDLMLYARLASGYRTGGPNTASSIVPPKFDPDKTENYEIGAKGSFLDHMLALDASLYYIDWKDIQLQVRVPNGATSYTANIGRAKSQGLELSGEFRPTSYLTIAAWGAWNDAEFTETLPATSPVVALSGDRLPNSAPFTGNFSIEQQFTLTSSLNAQLGGAISYVGERRGILRAAGIARQRLASYSQVDLHAGVRHESWTANLFVNNVADKRGVLTGGVGAVPPFAFTYIQPRTMGLSLVREF